MKLARRVLVPVLLYGGHYTAAGAYVTVLFWTAALAFDAWGCWATIVSLTMWPITLFVGLVVGVFTGNWWVPMLGLLGLIALPVGAASSFLADRLLRPRRP